MTDAEFKELFSKAWTVLPPSGTDFARFTDEQMEALRSILSEMKPGVLGNG